MCARAYARKSVTASIRRGVRHTSVSSETRVPPTDHFPVVLKRARLDLIATQSQLWRAKRVENVRENCFRDGIAIPVERKMPFLFLESRCNERDKTLGMQLETFWPKYWHAEKNLSNFIFIFIMCCVENTVYTRIHSWKICVKFIQHPSRVSQTAHSNFYVSLIQEE